MCPELRVNRKIVQHAAPHLDFVLVLSSSLPCPSPRLCLGTIIALFPSWTFSEDHFQKLSELFLIHSFHPTPLVCSTFTCACSNYLNSKSDMPFSTKQIWGAPSEIKKATWGTPHLIKKATLGRAPFNQEGKFKQIIVTNPPFPHPALCETTRPFLIQPLWNNHILEYVFCEVV